MNIESDPNQFGLVARRAHVCSSIQGLIMNPGDGTKLAIRYKAIAYVKQIIRHVLFIVA